MKVIEFDPTYEDPILQIGEETGLPRHEAKEAIWNFFERYGLVGIVSAKIIGTSIVEITIRSNQ